MKAGRLKLVLVTGLSGAGKSIALKALEDAGFDAIDNLPLSFLPTIAAAQEQWRSLAVATDIRSRDFSPQAFADAIESLRANPKIDLTLLYLDCDDEVLRRRFTETRRRHPLAKDRLVTDGIHQERRLLERLRPLADTVVDTTELNAPDLKRIVAGNVESARTLSIILTSFSFKKGLPREADLVFDVRFLRNPHYVASLKKLTGRHASVGKHIEGDADFKTFFANLQKLLLPLLPRYLEEGKSYLTVAIGCTGGQHRSVYVVEKLADTLKKKGYSVTKRHRDLGV